MVTFFLMDMRVFRVVYPVLLAGLLGCTRSEEVLSPATTGSTPVSSLTLSTSLPPVAAADTTGATLLASGLFVNSVHPTSGTIRLYSRGNTRTLLFSNFRTDAGPDLRIYVAENTALRNFTEVTLLNNRSGSFLVELPATVDPGRHRFVLIWCKAFSVLFGYAELK